MPAGCINDGNRSVTARSFAARPILQPDVRRPQPRLAGSIRGLSQRRPGKRAKSESLEHSTKPCSMASAAKCASGTRLACAPWLTSKPAEHLAMPLSRLWDPCHRAVQPSLHLMPRPRYGLGALEDPCVGHQAQERDQRRPGKPYGQRAAQAVIEPRTCSLVLHERADVGVDEKVGVEQNHRKASSSATASASVTLSRSPIRHRPKDTASVR